MCILSGTDSLGEDGRGWGCKDFIRPHPVHYKSCARLSGVYVCRSTDASLPCCLSMSLPASLRIPPALSALRSKRGAFLFGRRYVVTELPLPFPSYWSHTWRGVVFGVRCALATLEMILRHHTVAQYYIQVQFFGRCRMNCGVRRHFLSRMVINRPHVNLASLTRSAV